MYFAKMAPALKAAGITNVAGSRRDWPLQARQEVFQELLAETPKWLISKEVSYHTHLIKRMTPLLLTYMGEFDIYCRMVGAYPDPR